MKGVNFFFPLISLVSHGGLFLGKRVFVNC